MEKRSFSMAQHEVNYLKNSGLPESSRQPNRLSAQFYLYALLFILFDVEIIFMFPWAVDFKILGMFGFVEMISFILLLTIGFIYAWKKGAFQWHSMK
jgi:NADH-quinone oxidoreductase subunit A